MQEEVDPRIAEFVAGLKDHEQRFAEAQAQDELAAKAVEELTPIINAYADMHGLNALVLGATMMDLAAAAIAQSAMQGPIPPLVLLREATGHWPDQVEGHFNKLLMDGVKAGKEVEG